MENKDLTKTEYIQLLNSYLQLLPPRFGTLQSHVNIFVTLMTGIIAVCLAGLKDYSKFPLNFALLVGPILVLVLGHYAKKSLRKQDAHVRELIVLIAKLEYEIGLYDKRSPDNTEIEKCPWPEDEHFLPPVWVKSRLESGTNSASFINNFGGGTSGTYHKVFTIMQVIGAILFVLVLLLPLILKG